MTLSAENSRQDEEKYRRQQEARYPAERHSLVEQLGVEEEVRHKPKYVVPGEQQGKAHVLQQGPIEEGGGGESFSSV